MGPRTEGDASFKALPSNGSAYRMWVSGDCEPGPKRSSKSAGEEGAVPIGYNQSQSSPDNLEAGNDK